MLAPSAVIEMIRTAPLTFISVDKLQGNQWYTFIYLLACTLGGSLNIWSRQMNSKLGSDSTNWEKDSSLMA